MKKKICNINIDLIKVERAGCDEYRIRYCQNRKYYEIYSYTTDGHGYESYMIVSPFSKKDAHHIFVKLNKLMVEINKLCY